MSLMSKLDEEKATPCETHITLEPWGTTRKCPRTLCPIRGGRADECSRGKAWSGRKAGRGFPPVPGTNTSGTRRTGTDNVRRELWKLLLVTPIHKYAADSKKR